MAIWCSVRPLAASHLPVQPHSSNTYTLPSPPPATWLSPFPQQTQAFLPPGLCIGCSLNRNAPPLLLHLEDARHSPALWTSYLEAFQVIAGRVSCFLLGAPQTPPWVPFSLCSAVPTTLGCDWFSCLCPNPTTDWELLGGRDQLSPALWLRYTAQGPAPRRDPK